MTRRLTPSQIRSRLRQAEQKQRQAINKYNSEVRKHNQGVKRAVADYNRAASAHNQRVRRNRQRLHQELARLSRTTTPPRYISYRASVEVLQQAFDGVEARVDAGTWGDQGGVLLDLTEGETANSVEVLNALSTEGETDLADPTLAETSLASELTDISPELDQRWRGALFALDPKNPDAARHFCASSREILTRMLNLEAPDKEVLAALPQAETTDQGKPTRRSRVQYLLHRTGLLALEDFVESDLDNVVSLFAVFNEGTHGTAGTFTLQQLGAIKRRVEGAIKFLRRIIR